LYSECAQGGTAGEGEGCESGFLFWVLSYLSTEDFDEEFGGIRNQGTNVGIACGSGRRFERFLDPGGQDSVARFVTFLYIRGFREGAFRPVQYLVSCMEMYHRNTLTAAITSTLPILAVALSSGQLLPLVGI